MKEIRNVYIITAAKPEGRSHMGDRGISKLALRR
jgi:hypothetical protein